MNLINLVTDKVKLYLLIATCVFAGGLVFTTWKALNIPKNIVNNITQNQSQDQSQWQSTIIFPNKQLPFKYETFVYDTYRANQSWYDAPKIKEMAEVKAELDAKCVLWTMVYTINTHGRSQKEVIIGCFKKSK